ncbi:MAG: dicarboxylate/amino acid:cation symporter [Candidatus Faecousia sp.]|nr:dicarboxylate/amino acid:cation symporter [Clostridiales bacterium]MCI6935605.1 dicarboxylate/amino acid:cation symporter [Clostridiales bacterium]MDD5884080.1 dicarboxylate/amino acid:cation symporter [Bacillota bacterium]MDY4599736.1 dicarboxylate/amino acid:cation symporter [Candidatus Faecousia sp.]
MKQFFKNYGFLICMLVGIVAGCVTGLLFPQAAPALEPLGTIFTNLMFCAVVPMVFCSIASAIANMPGAKKAGKVMGVTLATFFVTAGIAAIIMYVVMRVFPVITGTYEVPEADAGAVIGVGDMLVNFFTKPDFVELLSRRAILPLIVFAVIVGFGIQMQGGSKTMTAKLLEDITACILKAVQIITYYAPIGFFGFFANLVATYGPELIGDYSRTLLVYYGLCFAYMFVFFPIYARFGGGKGAAKVMWKHLFKPAAVSFGTCSSVATIPTNLEAAEETGISRDVSNIVLPLGATMHMDGSAMSAILKVAFLFGMFGQDFSTGRAILAIVVAVFSSVAMSGIPGGGGTGELALCTVFFPEQMAIAYPMALALGNLVDPPATMVNAAGDYVASFIVARFVDGKDWLQKHLKAVQK